VQTAWPLAVLPGVPTAVIYAMAGWARMRLTTFLLLDLAGAFLMTGLVAGVGYGLGQHAVDLVLLVDRFASVVSLTLIAVAAVIPLVKRRIRRKVGGQQHAPRPSAHETDLAVPAAGRDLPLVDD
jgi:membrane protein DedA with SNARE-associated domain